MFYLGPTVDSSNITDSPALIEEVKFLKIVKKLS
jgi:hypothetical protein